MPDMGNIRIKDENMNKTTIITNVQTRLFELQDLKYRDFHAKLMPTVNKEKIIGVRTPALRVFAKKYGKTDEAKEYLQILPHQYYEENNLHGLLIEQIKDYDICLEELERFLPYIDNWATCDMLAVKVVKKHLDTFIDEVYRWMESDHAYTIRFGISMLMRYYLDDAFRPEYLEWVADVRSTEYYINMMRAWYFATALAKQPDAALPWLTEKRLDLWTHNKTIQKAMESRRIPPGMKQLLRGLRNMERPVSAGELVVLVVADSAEDHGEDFIAGDLAGRLEGAIGIALDEGGVGAVADVALSPTGTSHVAELVISGIEAGLIVLGDVGSVDTIDDRSYLSAGDVALGLEGTVLITLEHTHAVQNGNSLSVIIADALVILEGVGADGQRQSHDQSQHHCE